ncbi:DUF4153 domain-containing protein [Treponema zioleckii]|uniref:DUF4153 domain-containing protein n=1 Tax=Treponema zioleckii TaxID=331680 RepID=UPI00168AFDED|nr:DUF4153 domain-containing protein [Treponema zioleckii]
MNKEKLSIKNRIQKTLGNAFEYLSFAKVIFAMSFAAFVFASIESFASYDAKIDYEEFMKSFLMATLFALPATLVTKNLPCVKKYLIQIASAGAGFSLGYFSCRGFGDKVFCDLYYYGILCAGIMITLFVFIPKGNSRTYFALVFKHALFCGFMTLILMGGLSLLIYAVQNLILNTDKYEVYECGLYFCAFVFGINSFSHYLFDRRQDTDSGKAFKVIALYILFPVCLILILILYAYLLKALILFKLPTGQINWFVSFASCFYIVFYFILREYDELPAIRFFYKFGALIFIPLVAVQIYAYFIRVNAFGFTGYRYSSLLFIIFSVITFALTFVKKGRFMNYAILILSFIILVDSVSPFNLIKMAHKSQYSIMMKILNKYDMYDSESDSLKEYDKAGLESSITDDDRAALYSSYRYIIWTSKLPQPAWSQEVETDKDGKKHYYDKDFTEAFGIKENRETEEFAKYSFSTREREIPFDVSGFREMTVADRSESSSGYDNDTKKWNDYKREITAATFTDIHGREYDLTDFIFSLADEKNDGKPLYYSIDENTTFCFTSLEYKYNKDRKLFRSYSFRGYLFFK